MSDLLFDEVAIGSRALENRVGLAPMTRTSATADERATGRMGDYYAKFAGGGFSVLITEGTYPETRGKGYDDQPGLATDEQADSWERVVDADEQDEIRESFVAAADRAVEAGFDGVEVHGANGYLLDTYLTRHLNDRTDEYAGSPEARVRFPREVLESVIEATLEEFVVDIRLSQTKVNDEEVPATRSATTENRPPGRPGLLCTRLRPGRRRRQSGP